MCLGKSIFKHRSMWALHISILRRVGLQFMALTEDQTRMWTLLLFAGWAAETWNNMSWIISSNCSYCFIVERNMYFKVKEKLGLCSYYRILKGESLQLPRQLIQNIHNRCIIHNWLLGINWTTESSVSMQRLIPRLETWMFRIYFWRKWNHKMWIDAQLDVQFLVTI